MTERPTVSVVIPTRNRAERLTARALPAALGQRDVELEVVVVDDASDEPTQRALHAVPDDRVRILRHERHRGQAQARNTGIEAARGEWIAFLDDDDLWAPDKLREQLGLAAATGAEFVYTGVVMVDDMRDRAVIEVLPATPAEGLLERLLVTNAIHAGASTVLARASVVRELGGFDVELGQFTDWDLWIRLAAHGAAAACPGILAAYCLHDQNRMLMEFPDLSDELDYLIAKHARAGRAMHPDRSYYAHWIAAGHRRVGRSRDAARIYLRAAIRHRDAGHLVRAVGMALGEGAMGAGRRAINLVRGRANDRPPTEPAPAWVHDLPAPVSSGE